MSYSRFATSRLWCQAKQGKARQSKAKHGKARQSKAKQGKARQSMAKQSKVLLLLLLPTAARVPGRPVRGCCLLPACWLLMLTAAACLPACCLLPFLAARARKGKERNAQKIILDRFPSPLLCSARICSFQFVHVEPLC